LRNTASTRLEVLVLRHEYMQFAGALVNPQAELPAGIAAPPGVLAERFAVYRNNVFAGLIEALSGRFAITNMVVGDEFFRAMNMATTFLIASPRSRRPLHCPGLQTWHDSKCCGRRAGVQPMRRR
jgi:hypothetical protein